MPSSIVDAASLCKQQPAPIPQTILGNTRYTLVDSKARRHAYMCACWIGPKGLPIVGSLFDLIRGSTKAGDDFLFHQVALKYGPIAKMITLGEPKYYYKNWRGREWGRNRPRPQSNTCTYNAMGLPYLTAINAWIIIQCVTTGL